jgi:transcriptional regulator with XRE-family HTH domain
MGKAMTFAKILTRYRERSGLSKTDLGRRAGIKPEYIVMVEHGKKKPFSPETLDRLMDALSLNREERADFTYHATIERVKEHDAAILAEHRARFIADQGGHSHATADAECPYCHKVINIDVTGKDITVTGKITAKARLK